VSFQYARAIDQRSAGSGPIILGVARLSAAPVVLVVDDEPEVRHLFSQVLESGGFTSVEAASAEDAWSLLQRGLVPAGVLLDLRMPGMGGLGFLFQLRVDARFGAVPVTVVTGDGFIDRTTEVAVTALGAAVCFKPLHTEEILRVARLMTAGVLTPGGSEDRLRHH
jgi:CheY-like chemotaxis protein